MMLGARDYQLLAVLSEERHFGRAADRLAMRQPQLSLRVAEIERRLGIALFTRRPSVVPTQAGEIVIEAARSALADLAAGVERARRVASGQQGALVVAVASSVMLSDLPLSLQRFRKAWPDIELELRDMHSTQQAEALRRGLVDISITREAPADRNVVREVIGHQRFIALLPAGHRLAGRAPIALAELADEPFVLFSPSVAPGLLDQIRLLCRKAGFTPRVVQQAEEWYTVLGFVRAGFGISIALDIFGALAWSGLTACSFADDAVSSPVYLCWVADRTAAARDLLLEWIRRDASFD